jgi:hypothetical protein
MQNIKLSKLFAFIFGCAICSSINGQQITYKDLLGSWTGKFGYRDTLRFSFIDSQKAIAQLHRKQKIYPAETYRYRLDSSSTEVILTMKLVTPPINDSMVFMIRKTNSNEFRLQLYQADTSRFALHNKWQDDAYNTRILKKIDMEKLKDIPFIK